VTAFNFKLQRGTPIFEQVTFALIGGWSWMVEVASSLVSRSKTS